VASDYEILIMIQDFFKTDHRTKKYVIQAAEEPDNVPSPDICPMINIFPSMKERELKRMSGMPYIARLAFNIMIWEMSAGDYKNAFKLMSVVEENTYQVLLVNKSVGTGVLTSEIGATTYEHMHYENTFYIKASIPFTVVKDQ